MQEKIKAVLNEIRPLLQRDGGDVELVEAGQDGVVKVRLTGQCGCCPMSVLTLKLAIEKKLKEAIPQVKKVEQVQ